MKIARVVETSAPFDASVTWPSFQALRNFLNTSGCAFSISSSRTTLSGVSFRPPVSLP